MKSPLLGPPTLARSLRVLALVLCAGLVAGTRPMSAQQGDGADPLELSESALEAAFPPSGDDAEPSERLLGSITDPADGESSADEPEERSIGGLGMSRAVEIAVLLTALSLLPAVLITLTSFTRIVLVLSFVRRSLAVQELPPNPVLVGLALFLTAFVMGPVLARVHAEAYVPYRSGELPAAEATEEGWGVMREFLLANTRDSELELFAAMAELSAEEGAVHAADGSVGLEGTPLVEELEPDALPFRVVVPAFILSELKTAFQMGFLLFLPFLVIDLVIASVLISMGMFMLPPVMISTPFKILLFVLVDGWHLVCESLVTSFVV